MSTAVYKRMKGLSVSIVWIVITSLAVYIAFGGFLFIFQSNYVYYPERVLTTDPGNIGLSFENVSFKTADGAKLSGWFVPCKDAKGIILFCHGNAGNISHRLDSIKVFHRLSLDVFIFDYRGYGKSMGKPTESGTYKDVEAAWKYLVEGRQMNPDRIIVFGRSLGGAVAAWQARSIKPAALILESTFTSVPDLAAKIYPYLPARLLSRFKYDTEKYLEEVHCPVLIIHSRDDEMMPFGHGQRLFEAAKKPKEFLEINDSHNEGFITSGTRYVEGLSTFISDHLHPGES